MDVAIDAVGNELNTSLVLNGTDLELTDAGGTLSTSLSDLVSDADDDPTNELNSALTLSGDTLNLTDAGGTLSADLSSLTPAGCQGRSKIRPRWRRKTRPAGHWTECLKAAVRGKASGPRGGRVLAGVLAVCEAIAVAVQLQDVDVMGESVEECTG